MTSESSQPELNTQQERAVIQENNLVSDTFVLNHVGNCLSTQSGSGQGLDIFQLSSQTNLFLIDLTEFPQYLLNALQSAESGFEVVLLMI